MRLFERSRLGHQLVAVVAALSVLLAAGCQAQQPAPTPTAATPAAQPTKPAAPAAEPTKPAAAPAKAAEPTKAAAPSAAWAPSKPVEFVIHTNPGDGADIFMRTVGEIAQKDIGLKQPINYVSKVGGSGATMLGYLQTKAGDPHFLMPYQVSTITTPLRNKLNVTYKDFTPISMLATDEMVLAVRTESKFKTMEDLVAEAKKAPKSVSLGGGVLGASDTIVGYLLEQAAGIQLNFISFKGNAEAVVAVLGGNADMFIGNPSEVLGQIEAKKMRPLAVASPNRLDTLPEVPTLKELGYNVVYQSFRALAAPGGIPKDAQATWDQTIKKVTETAAFKKYVKDNALTLNYMNSAELAEFMDEQNAMFSKVLKEMGVLK